MSMTRREALKLGGIGLLGAVALGTPIGRGLSAKSLSNLSSKSFPKRYAVPFARPPLAAFRHEGGVRYYDLTARQGAASIVPGLTTPVYGYDGTVPGPTIEVDRGTPVVLRMRNHLPATHHQHGHRMGISTHLHGSASLPQYDGYASDLTPTGFMKDYHYPNFQPARTMWFHDHAEHWTAQNVYSGLAGFYILHDPWERANLPQGEFDVPLLVADAMFAADGSLGYDDRSHSGLWGDVILVNGRPWPVMQVKRRVYRFRILAGTLARSFNFRLSTGHEVYVIGTDGGIMPQTVPVRSWRHAGAERYEVLIDFRRYNPGTRVELLNASNKNNRDYDHTGKVMAFDVVGDPVASDPTNRIPTTLLPNEVMELKPTKRTKERTFRVKRDDNVWTFGGMTWHDVVDSGFRKVLADPELDDVEIWTLHNSSGGWFHPVHTHLVDFQILSRNGKAPFPYERGAKDVVYLGEGETIRILMKFGPHRGRYMVHCHNLPHEDHDMMAQFSVGMKDASDDPNDPISAAPPVPDPTYRG
jgi:spore coat protein A, manganese oxidase